MRCCPYVCAGLVGGWGGKSVRQAIKKNEHLCSKTLQLSVGLPAEGNWCQQNVLRDSERSRSFIGNICLTDSLSILMKSKSNLMTLLMSRGRLTTATRLICDSTICTQEKWCHYVLEFELDLKTSTKNRQTEHSMPLSWRNICTNDIINPNVKIKHLHSSRIVGLSSMLCVMPMHYMIQS